MIKIHQAQKFSNTSYVVRLRKLLNRFHSASKRGDTSVVNTVTKKIQSWLEEHTIDKVDNQTILFEAIEQLSKLFFVFIFRRAGKEKAIKLYVHEIQASADIKREMLKGLCCII